MHVIFIYNAKSGTLNSLLDAAHKIVSPSTYNCDLCTLTHGKFGERKSWKSFLERSDHEFTFYHKDEFEARFSERFEYPVILIQEESLEILLNINDIAQFKSDQELIQAIEQKVLL